MNNTRIRTMVAAGGLVFGLATGLVLPSSWIFVGSSMDHSMHGTADAQYACPMFCVIMEEMPDDMRCPVCGMELTVVSGKSLLNPDERRMIGLEVDTVQRIPLARNVRVVGEVDYDETRLTRITTRMEGWLETVWADTTWMPVKKGQKLASIYSPELYAAQQEYLVAQEGGGGALDKSLLAAAERRLKLLGIGPEEIAELERGKKVQESLVLRAPRDGVVVERNALEGAAVKKGAVLYTIADLSRVWVQAEVFERDLVWIRKKQSVLLDVEGRPESIEGRVSFIDPVINRHTRTARVRIEVDNPVDGDGTRLLRVGQRVDAWIEAHVDGQGAVVAPGGRTEGGPLAVPRSAVLSTGKRNVLYVLFSESMGKRDYELDPRALPDTVFYEMISVRLGPVAARADAVSGDEFYPVLGVVPSEEGLKQLSEGLVIVTKGNLLLDSQAQLSGKPSLLFPEGSRGGTSDPHAGH